MPDWLLPLFSILSGTAIAFLGWQNARRSTDRARIEVQDKRIDYLERKEKIHADYAILLRGIIEHADLVVPPYPPDPPN